jgi:hypothetical protein
VEHGIPSRGTALPGAVLISLLLHAALLSRLQWEPLEQHPRERGGRLSIALTPVVSSEATVESKAVTDPETPRAEPSAAPDSATQAGDAGAVDAEPRATPRSAARTARSDLQDAGQPRRLNLDFLPDRTPLPRDQPRAGGATVFDPALRTRLAAERSQRHSALPRPPEGQQLSSDSAFVGGRWQTRVQIGGKCFEVLEADPLDSLGREQWYAVDCLP